MLDMESSPNQLFEVAVNAPLKGYLTYSAKAELELRPGQAVTVPLGSRSAQGVVFAQTKNPGDFEIKDIKDSSSEWPLLPETFLRWLKWLSDYYIHPIGQVAALAFPPLKKKGQSSKSKRLPLFPETSKQVNSPPQLTDEQLLCLKGIESRPGFHVHLLHGVTGSGKTEVYLQLLQNVLAQDLPALVLVPEISLTPQLIARFSARFPDQVAVIHSHLTEREKTTQWWDMVEGRKKILIGARSALFCPLPKWGMIIIDEEHEPSFKQDEKLRYHARDAAIVLAKLHNCPIVLGSATPSLESWKNALEGRYQLHQMSRRVAEREMPKIDVVDLRETRRQRRDPDHPLLHSPSAAQESALPFWLSEELFKELQVTLQRGEQAALFLNRRGVAQTTQCSACGFVYECPNCAISLTLHKHRDLVCHYCDYTQALGESCPACPDGEVKALGVGTELIETDIASLFPQARLARADRDEIQSREDLEELIRSVEEREVDILIGTQMIAKGLDFPGLTLVGLILADVGFNLPDLRSSERSFQLLTQVSGRSGRHSLERGRVLVQTYNPAHSSLLHSLTNDFSAFAEQELEARRQLGYPPFGRLALLRLQGQSLAAVEQAAERLSFRAHKLKSLNAKYQGLQLLGPAPAPLIKLRNKFRYQMLLKAQDSQVIRAFLQQLLEPQKWLPSGTKVQIDIDPINML